MANRHPACRGNLRAHPTCRNTALCPPRRPQDRGRTRPSLRAPSNRHVGIHRPPPPSTLPSHTSATAVLVGTEHALYERGRLQRVEAAYDALYPKKPRPPPAFPVPVFREPWAPRRLAPETIRVHLPSSADGLAAAVLPPGRCRPVGRAYPRPPAVTLSVIPRERCAPKPWRRSCVGRGCLRIPAGRYPSVIPRERSDRGILAPPCPL